MKRSETRPEEDSEWFEFGSLRDVWPSGFRPRKLRFYADHDFPLTVVEGIRDAGLAVVTAYEDGRSSHDDGAVYRRARALDRILLTNDGDFWSDRRHRLMDGPGVIIVAAKDPETVATLLDRFYSSFASALWRVSPLSRLVAGDEDPDWVGHHSDQAPPAQRNYRIRHARGARTSALP